MNLPKNILIKKKSWLRGFFFYALPVSLKLSDLALSIYLLQFPWNHEANPFALWIIQRGILFSFAVFFSLSLFAGVALDYIFKRLLNPKVKKNIKILCGVTICYSYFLLAYPVVNNVMKAGYMWNIEGFSYRALLLLGCRVCADQYFLIAFLANFDFFTTTIPRLENMANIGPIVPKGLSGMTKCMWPILNICPAHK